MTEITVALGVTYLVLAIIHSVNVDACRRRIWCLIHSIALSLMGLLYVAYGVTFTVH